MKLYQVLSRARNIWTHWKPGAFALNQGCLSTKHLIKQVLCFKEVFWKFIPRTKVNKMIYFMGSSFKLKEGKVKYSMFVWSPSANNRALSTPLCWVGCRSFAISASYRLWASDSSDSQPECGWTLYMHGVMTLHDAVSTEFFSRALNFCSYPISRSVSDKISQPSQLIMDALNATYSQQRRRLRD